MSDLTKKRISTKKAPEALGPYSQAISANKLIYISGQLGINPSTGELVGDDIILQTKQALTNINSILKAAGSDLSRALRTTVYLKDMDDFKKMNEVYSSFFNEKPPARSTVAVAQLPKGSRCEIDCIALLK